MCRFWHNVSATFVTTTLRNHAACELDKREIAGLNSHRRATSSSEYCRMDAIRSIDNLSVVIVTLYGGHTNRCNNYGRLQINVTAVRAPLWSLRDSGALTDHTVNPQTLECGPMPNVMVALPNIGGALCSTPQSLADAHY